MNNKQDYINPPPIKKFPEGIYDTNAQGMRMICICGMAICLISISVAIIKICL